MGTMGTLRDDFVDSSTSSAWIAATLGSATVAETSGEARFTLPSSTAGTHIARYTSRSAYSLESDNCYINIDTMVATGVAATAFFQLYFVDGTNTLQWIQTSNTLYARTVIGNVSTDRYSATWNATTYKYLRIRETGGNIEWHSSTNGTSWTTRATLAIPFAITTLYIDFGATCGNIASPGSFRVEDVNLILPALSTTWRWTQAVWALTNRYKTVTLALDTANTAQAYLVTADDTDVSNVPTGNVRYWSGPLDGGRVLTEQTTQAEAEAMAANIPTDGRFDLATMVDGRVFRLYHRSIDGNAYTLREFYPRRLVQSDDVEAESIRTINLAAGAVTADKITVTQLSAITANIGGLVIDTTGYLWQGTGTAASPTTGLKIYNSGGIGKLSTYNTSVEQITIDTDGKLKAGAGNVVLDAGGIVIDTTTAAADVRSYRFISGGVTSGAVYAFDSGSSNTIELRARQATGRTSTVIVSSRYASGETATAQLLATDSSAGNSTGITVINNNGSSKSVSIGSSDTDTVIFNGLSVGSTNSADTGQVRADGYLMTNGAGTLPASAVAALGYDTGSTRGLLVAIDNGTYKRLDLEGIDVRIKYQTTNRIQVNSTGLGFFAATPVAKPTMTGSRAANAAVASIASALAALGLATDSTTA